MQIIAKNFFIKNLTNIFVKGNPFDIVFISFIE